MENTYKSIIVDAQTGEVTEIFYTEEEVEKIRESRKLIVLEEKDSNSQSFP